MELEMLCFPQLALTECQPGLESFYSLVRRGCDSAWLCRARQEKHNYSFD